MNGYIGCDGKALAWIDYDGGVFKDGREIALVCDRQLYTGVATGLFLGLFEGAAPTARRRSKTASAGPSKTRGERRAAPRLSFNLSAPPKQKPRPDEGLTGLS
jgi:hypothetical protein